MKLLSLIVPCFNEQESLPFFRTEIEKVAAQMADQLDFEIILVDDGSTDDTLPMMRRLAEEDARFRYLSLSRNFGKEAAMYAGMQHAKGDYVAIIDADLQHPPALLIEMYDAIANEGYDCAAARRVHRQNEPPIRSFFARLFYKCINKISKTEIVDGAQDFRMMTRQMVDAILSLKETNRFSKGLFSWVGFKTKWIPHENVARIAGETKWSFWRLLLYSFDGIMAFSTIPLSIASLMGLLFCLISFVMIVFFVLKTLIFGDPVAGFPTLICIIFLVAGVQLFSIGILGQYLAKMYLEIKDRPIYIVKETSEDER